MYEYRNWTARQREEALAERKQRGYPRHGPPHIDASGHWRIVTGACYEHAIMLPTAMRLAWFEDELLRHIQNQRVPCAAWVVLPNHYHILVKIDDMKQFSRTQGQLHGRTSLQMNREDDEAGRKVWHRCQDRCMRGEAHYYTTLNYLHNNPVKHGYVKKWGDWPYSSFHWYLEKKGRDWLMDLWREYPVLNYGDKWDV
jgi:putative transposase